MSAVAPTSRRRTVRWLIGLAVAIVAANVILAIVSAVRPGPRGPTSSSYATAPGGLAAYAELLRRSGHPVVALRRPPSDATLDPQSTVVLLDPDAVVAAEGRALRRFLERGGRLVAGGRSPEGWLRQLGPRPPRWSPSGPVLSTPAGPAPETAGVREVRSAGEGSWTAPTRGRALLRGRGGTLLLERPAGRGRLLLLADASPLQNRLLDAGDDAALALGLAGEPGRAVRFVETAHGYGEARGLGALPARWRWALIGLAIAALVWLAARARRLGPAEDEVRPLPPPRRAYVDALAGTLARTRRPGEVAEPLRAAARERLARRAGLPPDADDDAVRRTAERLGVPPDEIEPLGGPVRDDGELLAAGRALARVSGGGE